MKRLAAAAKYYAIAEGKENEYEVQIKETSGQEFKIDIDGKEMIVDFVKTGHNLFSLIIDNKSYEIDIHIEDSKYDVLVNGDHYSVEVLDELKKMLRDRVQRGLQGKQIMLTPMPGVVTKVMVEAGQEVEEGQPLLILVAMKMENQIKAPKSGVVQEVYVRENQTVSIGDKMIVIE